MKTTTKILAICLVVFGLASCGGSDENTQDALDKLEELGSIEEVSVESNVVGTQS